MDGRRYRCQLPTGAATHEVAGVGVGPESVKEVCECTPPDRTPSRCWSTSNEAMVFCSFMRPGSRMGPLRHHNYMCHIPECGPEASASNNTGTQTLTTHDTDPRN